MRRNYGTQTEREKKCRLLKYCRIAYLGSSKNETHDYETTNRMLDVDQHNSKEKRQNPIYV